MPRNYIQHNPFVLSRCENDIEGLSFLSARTVDSTIAGLEMNGNIAFLHAGLQRVNVSQPTAIMELSRFEGPCIMEHGDVLQEILRMLETH